MADPQDHLRELVARWRHAIEKMKSGQMATSGIRDGRIVDTTQETIADFDAFIAEIEPIIRSEPRNAPRS
jgi:hypothetical protein